MITFLGIGAQKSGTTWLHHMVKQHPETAVARPKEIDFFVLRKNFERGVDWYRQHFPNAEGKKAVGEFAPNYWWTDIDPREVPEVALMPNVPELVHRLFPDVRLIVSLRDPVDRAISAYYHHLRAGRLPMSRRISDCVDLYGIVSIGYYDLHLSNWLKYFSRERILVLIYEEDLFGNQRNETLARVFAHIGVEPTFRPRNQDRRFNPRSRDFDVRISRLPSLGRRAIHKLTPGWLKDRPLWRLPISTSEVEALRGHFEAHNRSLATMLGRELPW